MIFLPMSFTTLCASVMVPLGVQTRASTMTFLRGLMARSQPPALSGRLVAWHDHDAGDAIALGGHSRLQDVVLPAAGDGDLGVVAGPPGGVLVVEETGGFGFRS